MKISKPSGPSYRFPKLPDNDMKKKLSEMLKDQKVDELKHPKKKKCTLAEEIKHLNNPDAPSPCYDKSGKLKTSVKNDLGEM